MLAGWVVSRSRILRTASEKGYFWRCGGRASVLTHEPWVLCTHALPVVCITKSGCISPPPKVLLQMKDTGRNSQKTHKTLYAKETRTLLLKQHFQSERFNFLEQHHMCVCVCLLSPQTQSEISSTTYHQKRSSFDLLL